MSDKPAVLALEDELAAYFARAGFMAVEIDDLPDGSAIPWLSPIDLEELDPERAAKGSGQIAIVAGEVSPTEVDARVAAIAIPRLTTAEIEALRLHVVPSADDVHVDAAADLAEVADLTEYATPLSDDARAVLAEAWGPPPTAQLDRPTALRSITIPPVGAGIEGGSTGVEPPRVEPPITIPPLVFPHATLDLRAATRIVVAQRMARVDLADDSASLPWLAPVAISDAAEHDEVSISVIIYDAQLEVPV